MSKLFTVTLIINLWRCVVRASILWDEYMQFIFVYKFHINLLPRAIIAQRSLQHSFIIMCVGVQEKTVCARFYERLRQITKWPHFEDVLQKSSGFVWF